jgi:hypothetical protein
VKCRHTAVELYSPECLDSKKTAAKTVDEHIEAWLKKQIEMEPGYNTWHDSQNKVLSNPEIVEGWRFVGKIIAKYNKQSFNIPVCVITHQFVAVADKIKTGTPWCTEGAEETPHDSLHACSHI